MNGENK